MISKKKTAKKPAPPKQTKKPAAKKRSHKKSTQKQTAMKGSTSMNEPIQHTFSTPQSATQPSLIEGLLAAISDKLSELVQIETYCATKIAEKYESPAAPVLPPVHVAAPAPLASVAAAPAPAQAAEAKPTSRPGVGLLRRLDNSAWPRSHEGRVDHCDQDVQPRPQRTAGQRVDRVHPIQQVACDAGPATLAAWLRCPARLRCACAY
jgi:hypothetical protein